MMTTDAPTKTSDRIEEQVVLDAPRARVWRALTTRTELGAWFGANITGATIAPGCARDGTYHDPGVRARHVRHHHRRDGAPSDASPGAGTRTRSTPPSTTRPNRGRSSPSRSRMRLTVARCFVSSSRASTRFRPRVERPAFTGNSNGWRGQLQKRLPAYLAS